MATDDEARPGAAPDHDGDNVVVTVSPPPTRAEPVAVHVPLEEHQPHFPTPAERRARERELDALFARRRAEQASWSERPVQHPGCPPFWTREWPGLVQVWVDPSDREIPMRFAGPDGFMPRSWSQSPNPPWLTETRRVWMDPLDLTPEGMVRRDAKPAPPALGDGDLRVSVDDQQFCLGERGYPSFQGEAVWGPLLTTFDDEPGLALVRTGITRGSVPVTVRQRDELPLPVTLGDGWEVVQEVGLRLEDPGFWVCPIGGAADPTPIRLLDVPAGRYHLRVSVAGREQRAGWSPEWEELGMERWLVELAPERQARPGVAVGEDLPG